jgi:hypothetical protein
MKKQHIRRCVTYLIAILVFSSFVFTGLAAAAEPQETLLLSGVVKKIDPSGTWVVISVTNKSCQGMMSFNISNIEKYGIAAGDRVNFMIDSVTCPIGVTAAITDLAKVVPMNWRIKK